MKNSKLSDILFYLSLILVLCTCSFLLLFYEASSYEKINDSNEAYNQTHLPSMYLSNKMRSGKDVRCEDDVLIIENELTETHIYLYDGGLYELTILKGYDIDKSAGEKIFDMNDFVANKVFGKIIINYSINGKTNDVIYALRRAS